jgi:hypothetical protein
MQEKWLPSLDKNPLLEILGDESAENKVSTQNFLK